MPDWCPKCHAMLPPGLESCPSCGAKLGKSVARTRDANQAPATIGTADIFWMSAYIIGIALIPIILFVVIGLLCVLLSRGA